MKNKNLKSDDGFTIIEVLIVLAVAGLIMLIVFLAVPALQRNARNTSRKSDVSSLASALSEYVNNNNGQLPSASCGSGTKASCKFFVNWKPGYYTTAEVSYTANSTAPAKAMSDPSNVDIIDMASYETCSGESATVSGASARSVAIVYDVESGGNPVEQCVTAN